MHVNNPTLDRPNDSMSFLLEKGHRSVKYFSKPGRIWKVIGCVLLPNLVLMRGVVAVLPVTGGGEGQVVVDVAANGMLVWDCMCGMIPTKNRNVRTI